MNAPNENPLRLRHRVPSFHGVLSGGPDQATFGVERALTVATRRARESGHRQVVTVSPYVTSRGDGPLMRVQAWR